MLSVKTKRMTMAPASHPGRLLKHELAARKLSANRLSLDIGVPSGRITDILNSRRSITADTAVRLGRYFGNSAQSVARIEQSEMRERTEPGFRYAHLGYAGYKQLPVLRAALLRHQQACSPAIDRQSRAA